ncbi:hypothetical protein [Lentilactobacillus kosonis]|uniref:Uncharacterized protein n=1 Tax=Lentilactobacillus kosonis TaxID=2810561 RepID=A0A401FN38_9LACO|nr:hypothetical protein [Lentilactobacillus kosonis]GAY73678.1 hypothetical protein NBRC111893_1824 [Lentilactobacillus kosonis]
MDAEVSTFVEEVKAGNILISDQTTLKLADLVNVSDSQIKPIVDELINGLQSGNQAVISRIKLTDDDAVFRLESNLINLPLDEIDRINKMISDQDSLPVNVYLVVTSENVNRSGLRIDKVSSADELINDPDSYLNFITNWISEKASQIVENKDSEKTNQKINCTIDKTNVYFRVCDESRDHAASAVRASGFGDILSGTHFCTDLQVFGSRGLWNPRNSLSNKRRRKPTIFNGWLFYFE